MAMARRSTAAFLFVCAAVVCGMQPGRPARAETTAEVMELAKAGVGEEVMAAVVARSPYFSLTAADLVKLKKAGVPDKIVVAMLRKRVVPPTSPAAAAKTGGTASTRKAGSAGRATKPATAEPARTGEAGKAKEAGSSSGKQRVGERSAKRVENRTPTDAPLYLHNADNAAWGWRLDVAARALRILRPEETGRRVAAHHSVAVPAPPGNYKIVYGGKRSGAFFRVRPGLRTMLLLTRVRKESRDELLVGVYENGKRRNTERLIPLHRRRAKKTSAGSAAAPAPRSENKKEQRETVIYVRPRPTTTVIYEDPWPVLVEPFPRPFFCPTRRIYFAPIYRHRRSSSGWGFYFHSRRW